MRLGISRTISVLALGSAVIATTSVGVTFAVTKASGYKACATAAHVLVLKKSNGKCPAHARAVTLGSQGPRGGQGIQGKPGKNLTAPANVVVVSGAGTPTQNGTALLNTIEALPNNSPATTMELGPGSFDVGANSILLPAYLRLVGAGTDQTTILGAPTIGTFIQSSDETTIDELTVQNESTVSGGIARTAILVPQGSTGVRIDNVNIEAGANTTANARSIGIEAEGSVQLTNSEIEASATTSGSSVAVGVDLTFNGAVTANNLRDVVNANGSGDGAYAVWVESGSATLVDLEVLASDSNSAFAVGVDSEDQASVRDSSIAAASATAVDVSGGTAMVADSMVSGSTQNATCVGDYDASFVALSTICH